MASAVPPSVQLIAMYPLSSSKPKREVAFPRSYTTNSEFVIETTSPILVLSAYVDAFPTIYPVETSILKGSAVDAPETLKLVVPINSLRVDVTTSN